MVHKSVGRCPAIPDNKASTKLGFHERHGNPLKVTGVLLEKPQAPYQQGLFALFDNQMK
jgi:hypothetical protein